MNQDPTPPVSDAASIYVIASQVKHESNSGRDWIDDTIDPDYGYFTDKSAAQACVDELDTPTLTRYAETLAAFNKRVQRWERKQAEAQALGFANPDHRPWGKPEAPLPHVVIEIQARIQNTANPDTKGA